MISRIHYHRLEEGSRRLGRIFDLDGLRNKTEDYEKEILTPGFWDDPDKAQGVLKKKKALENKIENYESLEAGLDEIEDLIELAEEYEDEEEAKGIVRSYAKLQDAIEEFKLGMLLTGKYDNNDAIISIHAGTGGVDAMDWAEMLERMYLRFCEQRGYKVKVVDRQDDTVAGIKSCAIMVSGENAYGYLKSEHGVHRLVRISPFNSAGKRQTSFAAVEITPELADDLQVDIDPGDLKIDTYRASGAGGQHVNTTDSAIRITHLPTNTVVTCQNERSQLRNKEVAMKILIGKLTKMAEEAQKENLNELKGDLGMGTWGAQIRSYVFQPYTMVKDHRTGAETGNITSVMDGDIDLFIRAKLSQDARERNGQ